MAGGARPRPEGRMTPLQLAFRLLMPGARLHPLEILPVYACPTLWFAAIAGTDDEWSTALVALAVRNTIAQLVLFAVVVQIPAFLTGVMSSVDVAWPTGLVLLAAQALHHAAYHATADCCPHRTYLMGVALLLHGLRMSLGAFVMFFPFTFPNGDLPRYQYAKARWLRETAAERLWWLKQQHETLMQAYMNSVFLAAPLLLVAANPNPSNLQPLELLGFGCWAFFWILECLSDGQMQLFVLQAKRNGDITSAVIGYRPYDGWTCCLWTLCRHPNYFCEWMCWNAYLLMAVPSAMDLAANNASLATEVGIWVVFFYASRLFYDCLLYWSPPRDGPSNGDQRTKNIKTY